MDLGSLRTSLRCTVFALGMWCIVPAVAQQEKPQQPAPMATKSTVVFPDEYSDLDDASAKRSSSDAVNQRLEEARQYYLRGLGSIERGDTVKATRYFESAIAELNKLASTPGIEQNEDYTDLAQSVIEDYESYIRSIDNLGENSPLFILREKIFQEVERSQQKASIFPLTKPVEAPTKGPGTSLMTTIPLTQNEFVSRCIDFLTSDKGRKYFSRWIERTTKWFPMLRQIAKEEKMPEEIIHLAMIESALNPKAVSRASAVGMWQFIQSTGELYNLRVTQWTDDRRDPEKAARAAMRHLRDLNNELGNWHLALAAYNCGLNGVKRAIKASGVENPDFWAIRAYLPRETREYVPMYIAATLITMQHEAYGFRKSELNMEPEFKCDTMTVNEAISLKAIAQCAGVSVEDIRNLNTDLLKYSTPPEGSYTLHLPQGVRSTFADNLSELTPEQKLPWVLHEVKRGETLAMVAAAYNAPVNDVTNANELGGKKVKLRPGQILRIPVESIRATQAVDNSDNLAENQEATNSKSNPGSATSSNPVPIQNQGSPSTSVEAPAKDSDQGTSTADQQIVPPQRSKALVHTVSQQGETLYSIANRYGVRLTDLRNWNNLPIDNNSVQLGQKLVIYAPAKAAGTPNTVVPQAPSADNSSLASADKEKKTPIEKTQAATENSQKKNATKTVIHKVSRGETLAQIADDYNTSISAISKANGLKPRKGLLAGQRLKIPVQGTSTSIARSNQSEDEDVPAATKLKIYKVKRGDNIGNIAGEFGVREGQLKSWNPKIADGTLLAGQSLKIYVPQNSKGSSEAAPKTVNKVAKYYTAKSGDTMYRIAHKYGISIDKLLSLNKSGEAIRIGQRIRLQ